VEAFHHVLALLAFVFALSLTGLLSRASALFVARERVTLSGLAILAAVNCIVLVYLNWLSLWEIRTLPNWDLLTITTIFVFSLGVYVTSTLALPQVPAQGPIDMAAFYRKERITYYSAWLFCQLMAIASNLLLSDTVNAAELFNENILDAATLPAILLALTSPRRWAQWAGGIAVLVVNLVFLLAFETRLV
jgi:hypothetical protein